MIGFALFYVVIVPAGVFLLGLAIGRSRVLERILRLRFVEHPEFERVVREVRWIRRGLLALVGLAILAVGGLLASPFFTQKGSLSWPLTVDTAAEQLLREVPSLTEHLRSTDEGDLIRHHFGVGMGVRNRFGLWRGNWPLLLSCGKRHPDDCSGVIMRRAWLVANDFEPDGTCPKWTDKLSPTDQSNPKTQFNTAVAAAVLEIDGVANAAVSSPTDGRVAVHLDYYNLSPGAPAPLSEVQVQALVAAGVGVRPDMVDVSMNAKPIAPQCSIDRRVPGNTACASTSERPESRMECELAEHLLAIAGIERAQVVLAPPSDERTAVVVAAYVPDDEGRKPIEPPVVQEKIAEQISDITAERVVVVLSAKPSRRFHMARGR